MEKRVALIGIVVEDMESVEALNHILHEYGDYIIGRMGSLPLPWDLYHQHCCGRPDECHQHYFREAGNAQGPQCQNHLFKGWAGRMTYTREQLESLLALEDFHDIYAQADALRRETVGDVVHIRALLEFSNHCKRLCTYCGLNATDQKLSRFRMDPRDMIATAQEAARAGYRTIVLQSGEDPWYTPDRIGDIVKQIKKIRHGHHTELWGVSGRRLPVLAGLRRGPLFA